MNPLRIKSSRPLLLLIILVMTQHLLPLSQSANATNFQPTEQITDPGTITAVTVHRGWASVTRTIQVNMQSPDLILLVPNLPDSLIPDSIHAQILGQLSSSIIIKQYQQHNTDNTSANTSISQPTELRLVIQSPPGNNSQTQPPVFPVALTININYVVMNADWVPVYSLYAFPDSGESLFRADILVGQNTGEDWVNTSLSVSSARGHLPDWQSAFRMQKMGTRNDSSIPPRRKSQRFFTDDLFRAMLDTEPGNGSVFRTDRIPYDWSNSPLIERTLTEKVTIPTGTLEPQFKINRSANTDKSKEISQNADTTSQTPSKINTRICFQLDEFRQNANFRFIAIPTVSQEAFLVSTIKNMHQYHLLPGPASLFLNTTYTGEMELSDLAPDEEIEIAFGTDQRILVHRRELSRRKRKTGLLSDGREIQITYQLSLINKTGRAATVELWDQIPVSDSSDIDIAVEKLSNPLSRDESYLDKQRPRGLLRWDIPMSTDASIPSPVKVIYTLSISHPKDVNPAWLPE